MESEQFELAGIVKIFFRPAVERRGGFDIAQNGADIDGFAQVAANIFAKPLHIRNFPQKRGGAKKFLR